jgi:inner membrane protein
MSRRRTTLRALTTSEAAAALGGIGVLDAALSVRKWSVPVTAALDWPAHLLTSGLVLSVLPRRPRLEPALWAVAMSVAIDLDHVPLYLGRTPVTGPGGRPASHSLTTPAILATAALLARGRLRTRLGGLAAGTLLHFVRDIGTGPGIPLLWPLRRGAIRIPRAAHLAVLGAAAGAVALGRSADRPG